MDLNSRDKKNKKKVEIGNQITVSQEEKNIFSIITLNMKCITLQRHVSWFFF